MKDLLLLILTLLLAFFAYHYFVDEEPTATDPPLDVEVVPIMTQQVAAVVEPIPEYAVFLTKAFDEVFAPLDPEAPNPTARLHAWIGECQERMTQEGGDAELARCCAIVCRELLVCNEERERCEAGLRNAQNKNYETMHHNRSDWWRNHYEEKRRAEANKKQFFVEAQHRKWENYVRQQRPRLARMLNYVCRLQTLRE